MAPHVEMKVAAHMRDNDIEHAELLINNTPCLLNLGCESLIGVVLPTGSSPTVYGVDGVHRREVATVATLKAIYDRETGQNPISVQTQDHLDALIKRVRSYSIGHPCPAIVELTVLDDPWGRARLYAGIGEDRGFVQELWNPPRATRGDPNATGVVVYDLQTNRTEIPACQEVPLATVRSVLAAYLTHGGPIPEVFAELHLVD